MADKNNSFGGITTKDIFMRALKYGTPLPDYVYITKTCKRGHGARGYTVRNKISKDCVWCKPYRPSSRQRNIPNKMLAIDHLKDRLTERGETDFY